jgi:hypothetical protein
MEEMEIKYGVNAEEDNLENKKNKRKERARNRLPRRGGRSGRQSKGTANITILHSNCDGYISKKESIQEIGRCSSAKRNSFKRKRKVLFFH